MIYVIHTGAIVCRDCCPTCVNLEQHPQVTQHDVDVAGRYGFKGATCLCKAHSIAPSPEEHAQTL